MSDTWRSTRELKTRLRRFYSDLGFRPDIREAAKRQVDFVIAGDFNVFDYIWPNENTLSDIIADLLDPKGTQGQGSAFLQLFLETLRVPRRRSLELDRARVTRERPTTWIENPLRRVDVVIDFQRGFGIGIENKPRAEEQERQLEDYARFLDRNFSGSFLLLFLCREGRTSSFEGREQLQNEDNFRVIWFTGEFLA